MACRRSGGTQPLLCIIMIASPQFKDAFEKDSAIANSLKKVTLRGVKPSPQLAYQGFIDMRHFLQQFGNGGAIVLAYDKLTINHNKLENFITKHISDNNKWFIFDNITHYMAYFIGYNASINDLGAPFERIAKKLFYTGGVKILVQKKQVFQQKPYKVP